MKKIIFTTTLIIIVCPVFFATAADWKLWEKSSLFGENIINFYDVESLKYSPDGTIRVWIKGMVPSEFEKQMAINKKDIIEKSAEKVANGYSPPYSLMNKKTSYEASIGIICCEVLANNFALQPRAKFLFEINCNENKIRTLQVTIFKDNGEIENSKNVPTEWDYISPESAGEALQKMLCK